MHNRLVVKVGSGYIFQRNEYGFYNPRPGQIPGLVEELSILSEENDVILVSSGAIASAAWKLGIKEIPKNDYDKARLSGIGQPVLMELYRKEFEKHGKICAQCLITRDDFDVKERRRNLRRNQEGYFLDDVIAIYNENDLISIDEITFGDNDILAALLAKYTDADMLIMLSYSEEGLGFGGESSKQKAKKIVENEDIRMEIINDLYELDDSGLYKPKIRLVL